MPTAAGNRNNKLLTDGPGNAATGQTGFVRAGQTAQDRPSIPLDSSSRAMLKVAADLRETAHRLVLQAQTIEATLLPERPAGPGKKVPLIDPSTGQPWQPKSRVRHADR